MKRVALVNPDSKFLVHDGDRPPLGLGYLATAIRDKHDVQIFDFSIENEKELLQRIFNFKPEIIGFTATTPVFYQAVNILNKIKKLHGFDFVSVIGGIQATAMPGFCSKYFDYVFTGESEKTFSNFCDGKLNVINNILLACPQYNIDGVFPARDLLPMEKYTMKLDNEICTPLITSRGCPYGCVYCSSILGKKVRSNSADNIMEEILSIIDDYDIKSFYFLDDVFTWDKKRVFDFCKLVKDLSIDIKFRVTTRIDLVDKRLLEALQRVGCKMVCYGLESGSDRVLRCYNKRFTVKDVRNVVKLTKSVGIPIKGFWMTSFFETEADKKMTQDLIQELNLKENDLYELTIYPGSKLWRERYGDSQDFDLQYFSNLYHGGKK